ncbi:MAG TPA: hypothetical protein VFF27_09825 [Bacteroidia bacterium]|jgi:hypothetical protein|nr:hypothetical protein [Bacteroidia bacterium]
MENTNELKKYFDTTQYATTIVGDKQPVSVPEDKITSLISLLTDPSNKDVKEEALITLKKEKAGDVLLQAIASPKSLSSRHLLVAACWESEINFSKYLPFFVLLALDSNYLISLEAITTIENMEGPFEEKDVKDAIQKIKTEQKKITSEKAVLFNDLIMTLEGFLAVRSE